MWLLETVECSSFVSSAQTSKICGLNNISSKLTSTVISSHLLLIVFCTVIRVQCECTPNANFLGHTFQSSNLGPHAGREETGNKRRVRTEWLLNCGLFLAFKLHNVYVVSRIQTSMYF